jgi:hypothetical protein
VVATRRYAKHANYFEMSGAGGETRTHDLPNARTVERNTLVTGVTNNWDIALSKTFAILERNRLEFRWEAFNVFNHWQFTQVPKTSVVNSPPGQFLNLEFTDGGIRSMRIQVKFLF